MEGFPTGKAMVIGADFSWVEEVTGRSGDQVNNTDGGCKVTVLNNISPDIDPFVLLLYIVVSDKLYLGGRVILNVYYLLFKVQEF